MDRTARAYGRPLEALALLGCAVIFTMTVMICADVLLRNVRLIPGVYGLAWANEISEAMLYLVTLLTAPWLLRQGQHIRVDIVLRAVPHAPRLEFRMDRGCDGARLLRGHRLVRGGRHHEELYVGRALHQDAGDAGMVDAGTAADRLRPA